jgi:hypothetical protein
MRPTSITFVVIFTVMALASSGCSRPPAEDIVAEVGGHVITSREFADFYQVRPMLDQMIWETIVVLECNKRGITLDKDKYEDAFNMFIEQRGGREATQEWLDTNGIRWDDILTYNKQQVLQQQLIDNEIGSPTEEEINQLWNEKGDRYRQSLSGQLGIPETEITKDDVRDQIITEWRNTKQSDVFTGLKEKLIKEYDVKNYFTKKGLEMTETYEEKTEPVAVKKMDESAGEDHPGEGGPGQ